MIRYKIKKPFMSLCDGPFPKEQAWREIGLGHLLPMKVTGEEWPVQMIGEDAFAIGPPQFAPEDWHVVNEFVEVGLTGTPGPSVFQRAAIIPGAKMKDANGNEWIIPNANPQSVTCTIPNELEWGDDGPQLVPDEKYRAVMDHCVNLFDEVIQRETIDHVWAAEEALKILQFNYRISAAELKVLGRSGTKIITKDFAAQVVLWFVDYRLIEDVVKKN